MEIKDIISSGLLEVYATGLATAEERAQVEAWIIAYPEVADELSAIEKSMEAVAIANAVTPAESIKSKIFDQINVERKPVIAPLADIRPLGKTYGISPIWKRVAAAAVLLLFASAIFNVIYYNKYKETSLAYLDKNEELIAQSARLKDMDEDMNIVKNKYSLPVSLNGLPAAPDAAAKIFWMKNTGEVYIDPSNLPAPPEGKQYQLWAIVDGKPVDGGMIVTNKKGNQYHIQKMKTFGKAQAFAVTLETTGGNATPKGEMYVMGEL